MKIEVHLHTTLQRQTSEGVVNKLTLDLPSGSTLSDLLKDLEVEMNSDSLLLVVNGQVADISQILIDKDVVNLMPAISGG